MAKKHEKEIIDGRRVTRPKVRWTPEMKTELLKRVVQHLRPNGGLPEYIIQREITYWAGKTGKEVTRRSITTAIKRARTGFHRKKTEEGIEVWEHDKLVRIDKPATPWTKEEIVMVIRSFRRRIWICEIARMVGHEKYAVLVLINQLGLHPPGLFDQVKEKPVEEILEELLQKLKPIIDRILKRQK